MTGFVDRFGKQAQTYASARPTYPEELFFYLAGQSPSRSCAWDCATGNGQAALALAHHFDQIIATDASEAQLARAEQHPRVDYRLATALESGIESDSVDLVSLAQALHWFDRPAFFAEVDRVLRSGGLLAIWTYNLHRISPKVDRVVQKFHDESLNDYWSPQRKLVDAGYGSIQLPYELVSAPAFIMKANWPFDRLIGCPKSWSAVQAYIDERGESPLPVERLADAWGDVSDRLVRWPLSVFMRGKGS